MKPFLRAALPLCAALFVAAPAAALTPSPLFRGVESVGVMCRVAGATDSARAADELCETAASALEDSIPFGGPEVVRLARNDARVGDSTVLVVTLDARVADVPGGARVVAVAIGLHRSGVAATPLFVEPPVLAVADSDRPDGLVSALRKGLRPALDSAVARAF